MITCTQIKLKPTTSCVYIKQKKWVMIGSIHTFWGRWGVWKRWTEKLKKNGKVITVIRID